MPKIRLIGAAVKQLKRHKHTDTHTHTNTQTHTHANTQTHTHANTNTFTNTHKDKHKLMHTNTGWLKKIDHYKVVQNVHYLLINHYKNLSALGQVFF